VLKEELDDLLHPLFRGAYSRRILAA
jgi:hypothetical protein